MNAWERWRPYRVLAVDVDGTLAGADGEVTARTLSALCAVERCGIRVILVTGRALPVTMDLWKAAGLSGPFIACGGALIVQPPAVDVVWSHSLSTEVTADCLRLGRTLGLQVSFWTADAIWVTDLGPTAREIGRLNRVQVRLLAPGPGAPAPVGSAPVLKVMFGGEPKVLDTVEARVISELGDAYVARGLPEFIDVEPLDSAKRDALEVVLAAMRVHPSAVIAIGDGDNDAAMLDMAGLAVVPANAMAGARAVADLLIGHHDREGVAAFLEGIVRDARCGRMERRSVSVP